MEMPPPSRLAVDDYPWFILLAQALIKKKRLLWDMIRVASALTHGGFIFVEPVLLHPHIFFSVIVASALRAPVPQDTPSVGPHCLDSERISCLYLRHGVCLESSHPPLIDGGVLDLRLLCLGRS